MTRQAILIEASEVPGHDKLVGAARDVENWRTYLYSNAGGAWEYGELTVLRTPSRRDVQTHILAARSKSYVFVAYSGHGRHPYGANSETDTEVLLRDGFLPSREFNSGSDRTTIVVDACRNITVRALKDRAIFESAKFAADSLRLAHRKAFDEAVARSDKGPIYMYSCSVGESAWEEDSGGEYTSCLIQTGSKWHRSAGSDEALSTSSTHDVAAVAVTRKTSQQHPRYLGGRRLAHFPFAVSATRLSLLS